MRMSRRDFIQFLAVTAAGMSALPKQVEAFEKLFEANTTTALGPLVAIDELNVSGMAGSAFPLNTSWYDGVNLRMTMAVNLFGGIYRWAALPTQLIIARKEDFWWQMTTTEGYSHLRKHKEGSPLLVSDSIEYDPAEPDPVYWTNQELLEKRFVGICTAQVSYIGDDLVRHTIVVTKPTGKLSEMVAA